MVASASEYIPEDMVPWQVMFVLYVNEKVKAMYVHTSDIYRFIEMEAYRICQRADGIIKDEQVLVLVFTEGKNQSVQNEGQIGHQLRTCLLLQSSKGTA